MFKNGHIKTTSVRDRQTDIKETKRSIKKLERMKESLREKQTESYHTNVHKQSEDKERQTANI